MQTDQKLHQVEQIREFVIAGHGNLQKVKDILATNPQLLNMPYKWGEHDFETAIQAAAQVGSSSVANYLLEHGAPLEICTAAMLGMNDYVLQRLDANSGNANAVGAHGIPLLPHAVWSGNLELVRLVYERGGTKGVDLAFHNAVLKGNFEIVEWLLNNAHADIGCKNYQGKTALTVARERNSEKIAQLLKSRGATE